MRNPQQFKNKNLTNTNKEKVWNNVMNKLLHLPNISRDLEQKLIRAGIEKPEQLREKGSRNVFVKIKSFDSSACYNMLLALEGAIRGVLSDELDNNIKTELKEFLEIFNQ